MLFLTNKEVGEQEILRILIADTLLGLPTTGVIIESQWPLFEREDWRHFLTEALKDMHVIKIRQRYLPRLVP